METFNQYSDRRTKKDMKTAEEFLIEKGILIKDAKIYPINISRDTGVHTAKKIISALDEYADYKHSFLSNVSDCFILCENEAEFGRQDFYVLEDMDRVKKWEDEGLTDGSTLYKATKLKTYNH